MSIRDNQSYIAEDFSASLNQSFAMDSTLEGLAQSVEQKKQAVTSQSLELEALEARLRETEEKLKQKTSRPSSSSGIMSDNTTLPKRHALNSGPGTHERHQGSPLATQPPASTGGPSSQGASRWEGLLPQERISKAQCP